MITPLARRIFLAHLELSYRLGRKVTLEQFGELIGKEMGRGSPFTAAAVSRWENGAQAPSPEVIEAIGGLTRTDPGWISHGEKTAAPAPRRETVPLPGRGGAVARAEASAPAADPVRTKRKRRAT